MIPMIGTSTIFDMPTVREGEKVQLTYCAKTLNIAAHFHARCGSTTAIRSEFMPKEFKLIKSPEMLSAYLREAYARVEVMSDGQPHLYINQRIRGGVKTANTGNNQASKPSEGIELAEALMSTTQLERQELAGREIKEKAIILAGRTGAGKSTLGNLLNGCIATYVPAGGKRYTIEFKDPIFPVGHSNIESCTRCPNTHSPKNGDNTHIDYPGFDDLGGPFDDTINAYLRKESLEKVKEFKIVLVVDYTDISKRGTYLPETFNSLIDLLGFTDEKDPRRLRKLAESVCLVVSQVPSTVDIKDEKTRLEINNFLIPYVSQTTPLTNNAKAVLNHILRNERWDFMSIPFEHFGNKHNIEAARISKIVHTETKAYAKADATIQFKASQKHLAGIQTSIVDIIQTLNREFSEQIYREITNSLTSFYATAKDEAAIKARQKSFEASVQSTKALTLHGLLELFDAGTEILDKAAHYDKLLKFMVDLLPDDQANKFPCARDWLAELHLRSSLEKWNAYLIGATADAKVDFQNGCLVLQQSFPKMSQVVKVLGNYQGVKRIEIHGLHTLIIDDDLDLFREKMFGINVVLIAPHWEIRGKKLINLTGADSTDTPARAANGATRGTAGSNGNAGTAGKNGGNYFGFGKTFAHDASVTVPLTITTNGGNGGPGQAGGDGQEGTDGAKATEKHDFVETKEGALCRGTVILTGWDHVGEPFHHGGGKYDILLRNWGKAGGVGGAGGMGGAGGKGGHAGNVEWIPLTTVSPTITKNTNDGAAGAHGAPGIPGLGGLSGVAWGGVWHVNSHYCGWNGWEKPHTHEENRTRAASGSQPSNTDTDPTKPVTPPADKTPINVNEVIFNYRRFVAQSANPMTAPALELFRAEFDSSTSIQSHATVNAFIDECEWMEDLFTKIKDKSKCLSLYEAMLERIRAYVAKHPTSPDLAVLQGLFTLTLSKICQINAAKQSRLVIDMKGFLGIIKSNVKRLDKLDHDVQVKLYEAQYDAAIQGKIAESDIFIKKLRDDLKAADQEIDKQIDVLVAEITALKAQNDAKKNELSAKEKELKDSIAKKKLIGALTLAVQAIGCCFPPAGPIVAGIASAGLAIWNNPDAAPGIAANLLTPYLNGVEGTINNQAGAMHDAHAQALTRIRTIAVQSGAYAVAGSTGNSDEERLDQIRKAKKDIDDQQQQLDTYEANVKGSFKTSLHQVVESASNTQKALADKSKIALDFSRLSIRRAFENVKSQVSACTKAFPAGDGIIAIIKQMEDALETTADIYERVQEYEERRELVHYMALLAAPTAVDPRLDKCRQMALRNVILEQYARAVAAARQWAFPFEATFLSDFAVLEPFASAATVSALVTQVTSQLDLLQTKVGLYYTEVNDGLDNAKWSGRFANETSNGAFFSWSFAKHPQQITNFLKGKQAVFFADVSRTTPEHSAVKFTDIEVQIKCDDALLQDELDELLKGVRFEMHHSGISYYAHEGKVVQMTNDQGFKLGYKFGETDSNSTKSKIKGGESMLSPYTHWAFKLDFGTRDVYAELCTLFQNRFAGIEIHLTGQGQYILAKETT